MNRTDSDTAANERIASAQERVDLDAGFGPLRLSERRRDFEQGRSGGWALGLGELLRGISTLR